MELIEQRLQEYILGKFPLAQKQNVSPNDDLLSRGLIDSLGILDVVSFIEQQFGVTVEDEDLVPENFQSIDCMVGFVQRKFGNQPLSTPGEK